MAARLRRTRKISFAPTRRFLAFRWLDHAVPLEPLDEVDSRSVLPQRTSSWSERRRNWRLDDGPGGHDTSQLVAVEARSEQREIISSHWETTLGGKAWRITPCKSLYSV